MSACQWPSFVSPEHKSFFDEFLRLLDGNTAEDTKAWSEQFAPEAEFHIFGQVFKGREAIMGYLSTFRSLFPSLTHTPLQAYVKDDKGMDIIMLNTYQASLPNDDFVSGASAAHYQLQGSAGHLSVKKLTVYMDPTPLMSRMPPGAMQGGENGQS